jgi:hypothetical protein
MVGATWLSRSFKNLLHLVTNLSYSQLKNFVIKLGRGRSSASVNDA